MRWVLTVLFLWTAVRGVSIVASYADYKMTAPIEDILDPNRAPQTGKEIPIPVRASTVYEIAIWGPEKIEEGEEPVVEVEMKQDGDIFYKTSTAVSKLCSVSFDDGIHLFSETPDGGWAFLYLENALDVELNNSDFAYLPRVPGKEVTAPVVVSGGTVEFSETYVHHNYHSTKAGGVYITGGANVNIKVGLIAYNKAEVGAVVVDGDSVAELEEVSIFENEGSIAGAVYTIEEASFVGRRVSFRNQYMGSFATGIFSTGQSASLLMQCEFQGRPISEDYKSCLLDPAVTDVHSCGNSSDISSPVLHVNDVASLTVIGSLFTQHSTERGTIMSSGLSQLNVRQTKFIENVANAGGALYIESHRGASATLFNCDFQDNVARYGGALVLVGKSSFIVNSCRFTWNRAILGGAVWTNVTKKLTNTAEAVGRASSVANINVVFSDFTNNSATSSGGALFVQWADLSSNQSSFYNNSAGRRGGAIYVANSSELNITDTKFCQNFATFQGGAVKGVNVKSTSMIGSVFSLNTAKWKGGAFHLKDSSLNIQNSTFTNNYCSKTSQYEL